VLQYLFLWSISLGTKHNAIQYAGANSAIGRNGGRPSKKKQLYVRPKATVVTPDQAEAQLRAKTAIESKVRSSRTASNLSLKLESATNKAEIEFRRARPAPN
jgi:hypothetical protein